MRGGRRENAAGESPATEQEEKDGRELHDEQQPVEWDSCDTQNKNAEMSKERDVRVGEDERRVVLIQRGIGEFADTRDVDGGVFGERMVSVDEQYGSGEEKERAQSAELRPQRFTAKTRSAQR